MTARLPVALMCVALLLPSPHARAQEDRPLPPLVPPVDRALARAFEAPASDWGPGHRGIDLGVAPGVEVRAAAPGTVTFAGQVGGRLYVTIDHGQGLETTYSILSEVFVVRGEQVDEGRYIGLSGSSHPDGSVGLHFGVKLDDVYVDPLDYLGPIDVTGAIHLAPLVEEDASEIDDDLVRAQGGAGIHLRPCRPPVRPERRPEAPNDNVAVAVAGIGSASDSGHRPDLYARDYGPVSLGYPPGRTYSFSYRGGRGPRLHERYRRVESQGDIRLAAAKLRALLVEIKRRHPAAEVDLIAHSQGGVVARVLLEGLMRSWDERLPHIDHLVTLASPHRGTPLAALPAQLESHTLTGKFVNRALSRWAHAGGPLPDPYSRGVRQLAPASRLTQWLATEDATFGTRALSLVSANDIVVPAPRARFAGQTTRVLPVEDLDAHNGIVRSQTARAHVYAFLRDAAPSCEQAAGGPLLGEAIDFMERHAGDVYDELELGFIGHAARAASAAAKGAARATGWGLDRLAAAAAWARRAGAATARWGGRTVTAAARATRSLVAAMRDAFARDP